MAVPLLADPRGDAGGAARPSWLGLGRLLLHFDVVADVSLWRRASDGDVECIVSLGADTTSRQVRTEARAAITGRAVESMVTIVVIAFGLLGVAGLVSRSFVTEAEANQRSQAALLLQDMAARIEANRTNVTSYVTGDAGLTGYVDVGGVATLVSCDPAAPLADRDRCEWGQRLAGADERIDARNASMLVGAIGCVYELDDVQPRLCHLGRLAGTESRRGAPAVRASSR